MSIKIYTTAQSNDFMGIVKQFNADIYYYPMYLLAFESINDGKGFLFFFDEGGMQAINVFMKRDISSVNSLKNKIPENRYFDITTPYGYGGFLLKGNVTDENIILLQKRFSEWCIKENIINEFVRFHLFHCNEFKNNFYGEVKYISENIVVNIDIDKNTLWNDFEHKVRKNVKKAIKNKLTVYTDYDAKYIDSFYNIYINTMERNHASNFYFFEKDFFTKIHNTLPENSIFFHVFKEQKIISTELVLFSNEYAYSFLGGTLSEFYDYRPNDLLKYEIINWCVDNKIKKFILGGGYSPNDGIYIYKKSFSPHGDVPFYIGKQIYNKKIYEELLQLSGVKSNNLENDYFPLYRKPTVD